MKRGRVLGNKRRRLVATARCPLERVQQQTDVVARMVLFDAQLVGLVGGPMVRAEEPIDPWSKVGVVAHIALLGVVPVVQIGRAQEHA